MSDATDLALLSRWPQRMAAGMSPAGGPSLLRRLEADLPNLSPQLRKVATHLVRERGLSHRQRISDLAELSGTAPVTIVRLAQRYGFKGLRELRLAFLDVASTWPGVPDAVLARPQASAAGVAQLALDDVLRTIGALRPIVDDPGFMQAARWLREAEVVWVTGLMPGDALAADCMTEGLQRHGVSVRSGWMTRMAVHACALGDKSVQMQVALASALHRASDFSSPTMGQECRCIVLSRSSQPGISCAGHSIALGIDMAVAAQALPAAVGLIAAWAGVMRSLASEPAA